MIDKISTEIELIIEDDVEKILNEEIELPENVCITDEIGSKTIELNISKFSDSMDLNSTLDESLKILESKEIGLYGGGIVLDEFNEEVGYNVNSIFSVFDSYMHNLTSQQVLLGITDEKSAMKIYNVLKKISPILVTMFAASPYTIKRGELVSTKKESARMGAYLDGGRATSMRLIETPDLNGISDFIKHVKEVRNGLKCSYKEVEGFRISPMIRLRPDHVDETDVCSIEVRTPDTPINLSGMKSLNSFIYGIGNGILKSSELDRYLNHLTGSFDEHIISSKYGFNGEISGISIYETSKILIDFSMNYLNRENIINYRNLSNIYNGETDSYNIKNKGFKKPSDLKSFLKKSLLN